jgi:hypothetical protein
MDLVERLSVATEAVKQAGLVEDVEPSEIIQIAEELNESDYGKIAKVVLYAKKRLIDGSSRYDAFKLAFPERCVVRDEAEVERWGGSKKVGEELGRTTIELKAKRLESTRLYKYVVTTLNTPLHIAFAIERVKVLEHSLGKIFDPDVKDRDKVEYMKVFLQETRKPEKGDGVEFNVNITQNNATVVQVETKLNDIAKKLEGMDADSIINLVEEKKDE